MMVEMIPWSAEQDAITEATDEFLVPARSDRAILIASLEQRLRSEHLATDQAPTEVAAS